MIKKVDMDPKKIQPLIEQINKNARDINNAVCNMHWQREQNPGVALLDHDRHDRTGIPEVVFGENKTAEQIVKIFAEMIKRPGVIMATRVSSAKAQKVRETFPDVIYYATSRILSAREATPKSDDKCASLIAVVSAGTSDMRVAEEAQVTLRCMGYRSEAINDVGVAGIHRLYGYRDLLEKSSVLIVIAGMEGALPSVVAGLVRAPVIAVPTSVGYGTGLGGIAALLGMLNSCAPGVAVVNIDNGFGAACMAMRIINQKFYEEK